MKKISNLYAIACLTIFSITLIASPVWAVKFRFPSNDRQYFLTYPVFGVDHDPEKYDGKIGEGVRCTNYEGKHFPNCYDGHDGSDFVLRGGFQRMDRGSASVVAAASGWVIAVRDGNYDRCHASIKDLGVTCDGYPMEANYVAIEHADGLISFYYHLKKDSILVQAGDWVECGDLLAYVGSSGYSSFPHLHFEVNNAQGEVLDPFSTEPQNSLWVEQNGPRGLPGDACEATD